MSSGVVFINGDKLSWEELRQSSNGRKYGYIAQQITDTFIGPNAFSGCMLIQDIIVDESITTIHTNAFSHCSALLSAVIPSSVEFICAVSSRDSLG